MTEIETRTSPSEPGDPVMLVLTGLLRLGPMRVSRVLPNRKALGFMIPVLASFVTILGAIVGYLVGSTISRVVGGFDLMLLCVAIGGIAGYACVVARIDGKPLLGWLWLWGQSKSHGHIKVNERLTRLDPLPVGFSPPKDGVVVAASKQTVVYAVPARRYASSEVYLGTAPLNEILLGRATLADSTIPERTGIPIPR